LLYAPVLADWQVDEKRAMMWRAAAMEKTDSEYEDESCPDMEMFYWDAEGVFG
jgi:hypothetical protein